MGNGPLLTIRVSRLAQSEHEQQQSLLQDCRESCKELLFYEFKAFCLKRIQPS